MTTRAAILNHRDHLTYAAPAVLVTFGTGTLQQKRLVIKRLFGRRLAASDTARREPKLADAS